ncbi:hypothetical protein PIB30_012797 [Stylosanthes scabra]|uniref:VAN3-binding protein-like auxin canalisation domain-containing protein n=1 Tax=Stylosanthes scabra TaxID=79078 RepID=A0ABU6T5Z0_9FABA|nr:hypothetical protein [Stylosanthes scabra]
MESKSSRTMKNNELHGNGSSMPESPRLPMEFLSRSWSASSFDEVSKALQPLPPPQPQEHDNASSSTMSPPENKNNNQFSFAYSASSQQLLLERIFSQSTREELAVSPPLTSGRVSQSSDQAMNKNNGGSSLVRGTDDESPPISPSQDDYDDLLKLQ